MANAWPPILEPDVWGGGRLLSVEQWIALDEDERGELVAGELKEEEVPDAVHELAVVWLVRVLGAWLRGQGFVFGSELKLLTAANTGRRPDAVVYLPGTPGPPRRGPITRPPDIVVEVVTPSPRDESRDRVEKMEEYATFGVHYYWLVDPALGSFEMFGLTDARVYAKLVGAARAHVALIATRGKIESVPGCPGLTIDVDDLWAELERLPEN